MVSTQEYKLLLRMIDKITSIAFHSETVQELVQTVVDEIISGLELEDCVIYLFNEELKTLFQHAALGPKADSGIIHNPISLRLGEGIVGHVAKYKRHLLISDTSKDSRYVADDQERSSELAVPILYNERLIGVLDSEHKDVNYYKDFHITLFNMIAGFLGSAITQLEKLTELSNSERRFRQIVDSSMLGLMDVNISVMYDSLMLLRERHGEDITQFLTENPEKFSQLFLLMEFKSANKAAIGFFSAESQDHLVKNMFNLLNEDTVRAFINYLESILNGDRIYETVFRINTFKGETLYLQFVTRIPSVKEEFTSVVFTYKDITDEVHAKEETLKQKKNYELMLDNVPIDLAILDTDFKFVYISKRALRDDTLREYMVGKTDFDYCEYRKLSREIAEERREKLTRAKEEKKIVTWDETLTKPDGSIFYIIRSVQPVLDEFGNVQNIIGYGIDITDRKRAELSLQQREERLRILLGSIGEAVIATDKLGHITEMNFAAEQLLGQPLSAAGGTALTLHMELSYKESGERLVLPVMDVVEKGKHTPILDDLLLKNAEGTQFSILYNVAPIYGISEEITGAVIVLSDVTEKVRMNAELEKSQRLESIGILAGGIAHDFNNLLTGIIGNIDIALEKGDQYSEGMRTHLELTKRETLKATSLSNQLLTFSKGGEPSKKTLSLEPVIKDTIEFALHGSAVKTSYKLSKLPLVDVDEGQLAQVVQNLALNAIHAMNDKGKLSISGDVVSIDEHQYLEKGDHVRIAFQDSGVGLTELEKQKIFDPYFTTKEDGSGLGLATSFSILHRHNGFIDVESEEGHGATFYIYLPISKSQPKDKATALSESATAAKVSSVVVLDDEEVILDIVTSILDTMDIQAVKCLTGEDVIEAVKKDPTLTCFILDLTIRGGMGGLDTITMLRQINPKIKAIVSSGYSSDPIVSNYREHGFDAALPKPFTIADFKKTVNSIFGISS